MTHTREGVLALAEAIFGESNLKAIMNALDEFGIESHELEANRVKLAILRISKGDTEKLLYWVKIAKVDYRDVLAAQQLGPLAPEEGAKWQTMAQNLVDRWGKK
jgi:hypothetical protein